MRTAFVTVGPRGAGKTSFCKEVERRHSEVNLVSRDEILMRIFGTVSLNPYEGGHEVGRAAVWGQVYQISQSAPDDFTLILDYWNGYPDARTEIIRKLRTYGFEFIEAWYFITDVELCVKAWIERETTDRYPSLSMAEISCRHDYRLYHSMTDDLFIESDEFDMALGISRPQFDRVRIIDGAQLLLPVIPLL